MLISSVFDLVFDYSFILNRFNMKLKLILFRGAASSFKCFQNIIYFPTLWIAWYKGPATSSQGDNFIRCYSYKPYPVVL